MTEVTKETMSPWQQMAASGTGAILTSIFVTPLDVVKIRLQAQQKEFLKNKCFLYCNGLMEHICYCVNGNGSLTSEQRHWYKRPGHFSGTFDAFVKISQKEGVRSLWSGLPPTLVMAVPATMVYFTLYDQLKVKLADCSKSTYQPLLVPVAAGASARILSVTLISPLELVRTKMQSAKLSYFEVGEAVKNLMRSQGFFSLWRGLGPTLLRDVPFSSVYWAMYESLKQAFKQQIEPSWTFSLCAGATAGTVAAICTNPFDVIKTHRQIELGEVAILNGKRKFVFSFTLLTELYRSRGISALFSGLVPRIIKIAPACAIMISSYEFAKVFFQKRNSSRTSRHS